MAQRPVAALSALVLLAACAGPAPAPVRPPTGARARPSTSPASPKAPLVVALVVDQLAAWIADERFGALPKTGGFARLVREGTFARDMRYAHAATDTAPGHAALFTGAAPRVSGVFANEVVDEREGKRVSILRDTTTKVVTTAGPIEKAGSSAARLQVDTVADRLRAQYKDASIVSLSLKDRGAISGAGRAPTAVLWFDPSLDAFVTSTAFAGSVPTWARELAAPGGTSRLRDAAWAPLDEAWLRVHAKTPDAQAGEGDVEGFGITFPHRVVAAKKPPLAFRASPSADEALLALGLAAVSGERMGERPSLLVISLSAHDYVNHVFGPDSWEAWDELLRLDAALGRFFAALDAKLGAGGYAVLLSADHGSTSTVEAADVPATHAWCAGKTPDRWDRACPPVGRLLMDELTAELRAAAKTALGEGSWISGMADPYVYFTAAANALPASRREALVAAARATLASHREVDRVVDVRTIAAACPAESDDSLDALVCRSYPPGASTATNAALYVLTKKGSYFDPDYVVGKGMSHGSPYLYDRSVPLLVRPPSGASGAATGRVIDEPVTFSSYARTAAALLGVAPPDAARGGRDLSAESVTSASGRP